jgi:hypothetical protein
LVGKKSMFSAMTGQKGLSIYIYCCESFSSSMRNVGQ